MENPCVPSIEKWINKMVNTAQRAGRFSALLEIHSVNSSILERQTENYIPEGINDLATFVGAAYANPGELPERMCWCVV